MYFNTNFATKRKNLYLSFIKLYLLISVVLRVVLWYGFGKDAQITLLKLPGILLVGLLNDTLQLVYLLFPLTLYLLILPNRVTNSYVHKIFFYFLSFLIIFGTIYLAPAEYFFFDEFDSRFNLVAVDYLIYPTEVLGNIWESYPVVWFVAGGLMLAAFVLKYFFIDIKEAFQSYVKFKTRFTTFIIHASLILILALNVSTNTLALSKNRVWNELSANGISSFFNALLTQSIDFERFYRTLPKDEAYKIIREHLVSTGGGVLTNDMTSTLREIPADPKGLGKLNIVILSEESLGAQYVGAYGDTRGLTPVIDKLAEESLVFKEAYATGTRTVRGLEAMSASFPPIPSESIIKRPKNENLTNIGKILGDKGYNVSFLYGGFGLFDNMNYFFKENGWKTSDRSQMEDIKFSNIWGVSDEDLMHHAVKYFDEEHKANKPFLSLVMTTSNHKPFTFPEGIEGITPKGGGREMGVKYADYAIGKFFEEAKTKPWFDNTIFVVIADHDSRVYGRAYVPVERYKIPALIYSPKHIKPEVVNKTFSNMDLAPTLLGLLGVDYSAPFFGVNVLSPNTPDKRPILLSHNHDVAIYENNEVTVLGIQKKVETYEYEVVDRQGKTKPTVLNQKMADLVTAYIQTAYNLFEEHRY